MAQTDIVINQQKLAELIIKLEDLRDKADDPNIPGRYISLPIIWLKGDYHVPVNITIDRFPGFKSRWN